MSEKFIYGKSFKDDFCFWFLTFCEWSESLYAGPDDENVVFGIIRKGLLIGLPFSAFNVGLLFLCKDIAIARSLANSVRLAIGIPLVLVPLVFVFPITSIVVHYLDEHKKLSEDQQSHNSNHEIDDKTKVQDQDQAVNEPMTKGKNLE